MSKLRSWLSRPTSAWCVGIVMPIVMVAVDPIVFREDGELPTLGAAMPGCYCAILLGMIALAIHLRRKRASAFIAGVLVAATLFAAVLGVVILPLSIMGILLFGVGLLGLSPFMTALVFGAQARGALNDSPSERRMPRFLLGFALYFGMCGLVQWRVGEAWLRCAMTLSRSSSCWGRL